MCPQGQSCWVYPPRHLARNAVMKLSECFLEDSQSQVHTSLLAEKGFPGEPTQYEWSADQADFLQTWSNWSVPFPAFLRAVCLFGRRGHCLHPAQSCVCKHWTWISTCWLWSVMLFITKEIAWLSRQTVNIPGRVCQLGRDLLSHMRRLSHSVVVFVWICFQKLLCQALCPGEVLLSLKPHSCPPPGSGWGCRSAGGTGLAWRDVHRNMDSAECLHVFPISRLKHSHSPLSHLNAFELGVGARVRLSRWGHMLTAWRKAIPSRDSASHCLRHWQSSGDGWGVCLG